jgi:hypothetical protein
VKRVSLTPSLENLSALSWAGGFGVMGHGVRVGIRVNDESFIPHLLKHLPETAKPLTSDSLVGRKFDCVLSVIRGSDQRGTPEHSLHLIHHKLEHSAQARHEEDFLEAFNSQVGWAIASLSPRRVFVHAGAVGWQGRAIIIPGASLSGKSTLVAELVRAGATYLSDEFAVLDCGGRVYPFPKPIALRPTPGSTKQVNVPVEAFGGRVGKRSIPLGFIVLTGYEEGARWQPKVLSPGRGVLGLLSNSPAGQIAPTRVLRILRGMAKRATTISSPRGEAADIVPRLLDLAGGQVLMQNNLLEGWGSADHA